MTETIAIVAAAACVVIILAHCGLYVWLRKLEGR
jgi:uncharacterized iron-regulated membrane protein